MYHLAKMINIVPKCQVRIAPVASPMLSGDLHMMSALCDTDYRTENGTFFPTPIPTLSAHRRFTSIIYKKWDVTRLLFVFPVFSCPVFCLFLSQMLLSPAKCSCHCHNPPVSCSNLSSFSNSISAVLSSFSYGVWAVSKMELNLLFSMSVLGKFTFLDSSQFTFLENDCINIWMTALDFNLQIQIELKPENAVEKLQHNN